MFHMFKWALFDSPCVIVCLLLLLMRRLGLRNKHSELEYIQHGNQQEPKRVFQADWMITYEMIGNMIWLDDSTLNDRMNEITWHDWLWYDRMIWYDTIWYFRWYVIILSCCHLPTSSNFHLLTCNYFTLNPDYPQGILHGNTCRTF